MAVSGMEMMLGNMLKSMGIDKDVMMAHANNAQTLIVNLDKRLTKMEQTISETHAMMESIYDRLNGGSSHDQERIEGLLSSGNSERIRIREVVRETVPSDFQSREITA